MSARTSVFFFSGFLSIFLVMAASNETTYDQRQSGDYNIHISLKDIKIIALLNGGLGGSEDYDYNYDYSEMTIKPSIINQNLNSTTTTTTPKSSTTTKTVATTTEKIVEITPKPVTNVTKNSTNTHVQKPIKDPNHIHDIPVQIVLTPVEVVSNNVSYPHKNTSSTVHSPARTQANCIEGFMKDREGNCRPKVKKLPQQTLLRRLIQQSHRGHHTKH